MDLNIINAQTNEKVNLEKWAKYTVEKFEFAVAKYKLKNTGKLLNSFLYQVSQDADGKTAMISFAFQYYLRMIDMGVGRGTTRDSRQERSEMGKRRKKRPVYNKIFWSELSRLNELLQEYYKKEAQNTILDGTIRGKS